VKAALVVGIVWWIWHAMYMISPETGELDLHNAMLLLTLPAYAVIFAWYLHRTNGSLAVALALHAGGHLDSSNRIPHDELRLRVLTIAVVVLVAVLAARSLRRSIRVR
jgi:hypothetical protein